MMNVLPQNSDEPERVSLTLADDASRAARPAWMKPKAVKPPDGAAAPAPKPPATRPKVAPSPQSAVRISVDDQVKTDLHWTEQAQQWLKGKAAGSCATSLGFHLLLLALLSFILMKTADPPAAFIIGAVDEEGEQTEFEEVVDVQLDVAKLETDASQSPMLQPLLNANPDAGLPMELQNSISAITSVGKNDLMQDSTGGFRMPASGKVVRKGSFVAWTVPEDPEPLQNYKIIIQVELPRSVKNYNQSDISGFMTGTDGYRTPIGQHRGGAGFRDGYYGEFNLQAKQLVITIPGAEKSIRDTIEVESRLLKEKQKLEIVF